MKEERSLARALGLPIDPFTRPAETFFAAGNRTRQLDELRQLSRGTRRLLAVTGDRGVGKTVMFRTLSSRLDPGVKAARINANLTNDVMGVLLGVLQGLGLGLPERDKPDALAEVIVEHACRQGDASRYDLVMVDDAHALELKALEMLLGMLVATPQRGLRIVFFAEVRFVRALEKAVGRIDSGLTWHEIRLTPFSRDEVRRYLEFRFAEVDWDDHLPFTKLQIQELIADSGGLPGVVDERVSTLLSGPVDGGRTAAFPALHRAALSLLLVVAGMVWFVWRSTNPESDPEADPGRSAEPARTVTVPAPTRVQREPAANLARSSKGLAKSVKEGGTGDTPLAGEPTVVTVPTEADFPPRRPDEVVDEPGVSPIDPSLALVPVPLKPEPEPEPKPEPKPEPEPTKQIEPRPTSPAAVDRSSEAGVRPARALPLAESPVAPRAEPEPEPESAPARLRGGAKDVAWIMRQLPDRYTLQLFGTSNRDRLVAYVNRQEEIGEFALLTLERDGQPWYVVTYGVFSSPSAARTAAERLPETLGRVDPWVRQFSAVQSHVQESSPN